MRLLPLAIAALCLAAISVRAAASLPRVLFFANPMSSDNDVIRRGKDGALSVAERRFGELARGHFEVTITQEGREITAANLARYDAVVFFTAIEPPGVDVEALIAWVKAGGAFTGIHSTANSFKRVPAFGEMLGAIFDQRPWRTAAAPQTRVRVLVNDGKHPATRHLPAAFDFEDDIYQFKAFAAADVRLLLSLDRERLDLQAKKVDRNARIFPVAWTRDFGAGRVFYTALGDWDPTWQDERYRTHLMQGILWTLKRAE
ncbi:MAG TPA: ThuA domain-containing protein [Opitutaceae bacterium]